MSRSDVLAGRDRPSKELISKFAMIEESALGLVAEWLEHAGRVFGFRRENSSAFSDAG